MSQHREPVWLYDTVVSKYRIKKSGCIKFIIVDPALNIMPRGFACFLFISAINFITINTGKKAEYPDGG